MTEGYIKRNLIHEEFDKACSECRESCMEFDGFFPDCDECILHGVEERIKAIPTDDVATVRRCDYCHEDMDGFVRPIEKNCHASISYPNKLILKFGKERREVEINYCPMCGRNLNDVKRIYQT